jgi:four helix bundle protein
MDTTSMDFYLSSQTRRQIDTLSVDYATNVRALCMSKQNCCATDRSTLLQFYRSSTSVGANIRESRYAESVKDYIHKLKIAEKELAESAYWLGIVTSHPPLFTDEEATAVRGIGASLRRLLSQTIRSLKDRSH